MKALLDTNICVYAIKKKPPEVIQKLLSFGPGDLAISSLTYAELVFGASKSQHKVQAMWALECFMASLIVVAFDVDAAVEYGRIRSHLEGRGTQIGTVDTFIAAQALQLGVPVVTNNEREFVRVPGLIVENWVEV